ncbi:MAG: nucleoside triphosphate pyrophosphatase [Vicinamibacterales bacterium]
MRLVLASASPRRAELLRAAGYEFTVSPVEIDERVHEGESPESYVRRLASEKSRLAHQAEEPSLVTLGADTAVVVDGTILGKPVDRADAERMLRLLSGRTHDVFTGVSLRCGGQELVHVERTRVDVRRLGDDEVARYIESGEGRDKAGGYAIQGLASRFIPRIEGSYSSVVGLPVAAVAERVARLVPETRQAGGAAAGRV